MSNKALLFIVFCFLHKIQHVEAQRNSGGYWQQKVQYYVETEIDVETSQYSGTQEIKYTNNSPERLSRVYFHLYYNAFKPGSEMDVRSRTIADPDSRVLDRIEKLSTDDQGFLNVVGLKQDGEALKSSVAGTVLEVQLNKVIEPGETTVFKMSFKGQAPLIVRRAGKNSKEGVAFSMAQWYPKMAEYDFEGWHANPYIGREFYGVWGDFDVKIKIDSRYIVGGTGYLQNPEDIKITKKASKNSNTWHFYAPAVHDFTWAADPEYIHDVFEIKKGPKLNFYYKKQLSKEHLQNWKKLQPVTAELMGFFSENIGVYPYNQYSVIQGGDGGMEYGMCTLITGQRPFKSLVGVTAHELAHSWFHFLLATNESKHEWMDEGFTEYFCTGAEAEIMGINKDEHYKKSYERYRQLVFSGAEQPLTTHADRYNYNFSYGVAAYVKGSIFLRQLKHIIGEEAFEKTIKNYFNNWSFKHPTPNDFIRCAEKASGSELDWYLTDWTKTTNTIDYGVKAIEKLAKKTTVTLERVGLMPFPVDLEIVYNGGRREKYYIPLQIMRVDKPLQKSTIKLKDWAWANPLYSFDVSGPEEIASITIDPTNKIADINLTNNSYEFKTNE